MKNIERDPRVTLSVEAPGENAIGMKHYLVVHGKARITEGGAPELLQKLAETYVGPDVKFPPMPIRRRAWSHESPRSGSAAWDPGRRPFLSLSTERASPARAR